MHYVFHPKSIRTSDLFTIIIIQKCVRRRRSGIYNYCFFNSESSYAIRPFSEAHNTHVYGRTEERTQRLRVWAVHRSFTKILTLFVCVRKFLVSVHMMSSPRRRSKLMGTRLGVILS